MNILLFHWSLGKFTWRSTNVLLLLTTKICHKSIVVQQKYFYIVDNDIVMFPMPEWLRERSKMLGYTHNLSSFLIYSEVFQVIPFFQISPPKPCMLTASSSSSSSSSYISVMELGHLLTPSGLTYPEVSSKVCHDSICQLGSSVSLPWVIYYVNCRVYNIRCLISYILERHICSPYAWYLGRAKTPISRLQKQQC